MSDFEHALEAELLAAARRRTAARRRRRPPALFAVGLATASVVAFVLVPHGTSTAPSAPVSSPPCSAQESLLGAGPCTSNPFSSLSQ